MKAYERLIEYVKIWTTSDDDNYEETPSTKRQFDLAYVLEKEMKNLGMSEVEVDEHSYVYGYIPATGGYENVPTIALIAHLDSAPSASGQNVKPIIHENYDGKDIVLENGLIISTEKFPHLKKLMGHTLITTDGTTLLGGDDKAGIAEILTLIETLVSDNIPHGKIWTCFTPDEEIGHGAELLDIKKLGADFAYTVDGSDPSEVEYGNFNACHASIKFQGFNIHPGEAKDKMKNAALIATEFAGLLPADEIPAKTEKREGFFHLIGMKGDVECAEMYYIIRDHDSEVFEARQQKMKEAERIINEKYGQGTCSLSLHEEYRNMEDLVKEKFEIVEYALESVKAQGLEPICDPVRGGTDGARLSFRGLLCPNIGTGGYAFHGPYEHISAQNMDIVVNILLGIIKRIAKH